ncbi:MAG TPA: acylneuraminate cytidylyltransferase [Ohtaekwangia sp.]|uniref:cytidylyltransferase domain-containing protein n=1 Tax=Ohtaekwangia sp. TaxID=2066019 RepID=UPI002F9319F7
MNVLVIIPARGGSKGIPRKNLRPLNGKPLIYYSINLARASVYKPDVYVSTDDEEIAYFSRKFGAKVHLRDNNLGGDLVTLDPVIYEAYTKISSQENKQYDFVITLQPTSPLLTTYSLDQALKRIHERPEIETILSAVNDTHLTWGKNEGGYFPNYKARVNRQQLPPVYKETGGFFISRASIVTPAARIGKAVDLYEVPVGEAIDIDSHEDWSLCEYLLQRKTILFCISGYPQIGLGHVYNCLTLAHHIMNHKIVFLVDKKSDLAFAKIKENNFEVHQEETSLLEDIQKLAPDIVVNDRLDTDANYVKQLRQLGFKVVNIEDLGEGSAYAHVVINAIYPEKESPANHYYGPDYFCAREEFLLHGEKPIRPQLKKVLLSFGGVDPNNLTRKTLQSIYTFCMENKISIQVILGLGYANEDTLKEFSSVEITRNVKNISDYMYDADIVFSSAGRTIYELALLGTPSIIMAQNERELTHFFASGENGFLHLGLGSTATESVILGALNECLPLEKRQAMHERMMRHDIKNGRKRVIKLINELIENTYED